MRVRAGAASAHVGGLVGIDLQEVTDDVASLDHGGRWAVALPYDGPAVLARFGRWEVGAASDVEGPWCGPQDWTTSLDRGEYIDAVDEVRSRIAAGDVYQANICRVMASLMPDPKARDIGGLHALLSEGNPAPFAGMLRLPDHDVHIACASPELFLRRAHNVVESGPIKGTGRTPADLTAKDEAENVMIVDLVRNDLSRVCLPGTVTVPALMSVEEHPGLVHLVSTVRGELVPGAGWADIIGAAFPPGSVTGAPKIAALQIIDGLETVSREFYCGAFGWVDADQGTAELAVAIRTFWRRGDVLRFGTGAGITWGSDAAAEWAETELKAARLVALAAGTTFPATVAASAMLRPGGGT